LTLTPLVFNAAAQVVFLVAGAEKAEILPRVLTGLYQPGLLPAQAILPAGGPYWLADLAAAQRCTLTAALASDRL
jgi:6-phosphogluconolactonase